MWLKVQLPSQGVVFFSLLSPIQSCMNKRNPAFGCVSPPRSLTVVTEQMEQFSSHLGELCSFSVMQDRLAEQQKAAVEERAFLKDIISRMHTQLREQERQFEKVGTESPLAPAAPVEDTQTRFCALGTLEGNSRGGQGGVGPKKLGGRAARPRQRERGSGKS